MKLNGRLIGVFILLCVVTGFAMADLPGSATGQTKGVVTSVSSNVGGTTSEMNTISSNLPKDYSVVLTYTGNTAISVRFDLPAGALGQLLAAGGSYTLLPYSGPEIFDPQAIRTITIPASLLGETMTGASYWTWQSWIDTVAIPMYGYSKSSGQTSTQSQVSFPSSFDTRSLGQVRHTLLSGTINVNPVKTPLTSSTATTTSYIKTQQQENSGWKTAAVHIGTSAVYSPHVPFHG